jgi:hypothetical protein
VLLDKPGSGSRKLQQRWRQVFRWAPKGQVIRAGELKLERERVLRRAKMPVRRPLLTGLINVMAAHSVAASPPAHGGHSQCTASCDSEGKCLPLRYVWGAQKGGTTALWEMLSQHLACGAKQRFHPIPYELRRKVKTEKESHYLTRVRESPSRVEYMGAYLRAECASHCFIEATPYLMVPSAAARLKSMMSSAEAVRSRRTLLHCQSFSLAQARPAAANAPHALPRWPPTRR